MPVWKRSGAPRPTAPPEVLVPTIPEHASLSRNILARDKLPKSASRNTRHPLSNGAMGLVFATFSPQRPAV
jgi:hypothetical protein